MYRWWMHNLQYPKRWMERKLYPQHTKGFWGVWLECVIIYFLLKCLVWGCQSIDTWVRSTYPFCHDLLCIVPWVVDTCRVSGNELISMVMFLLLLVLLVVVGRRQGPMALSSQKRSLFLEVTVHPMGFLTRTRWLASEMRNEPASTRNISKIGKQHHFGCSRWLKPPMQLSKNSSC